jgi:acyl-CoA thioester hydrolase
MTLKVSFEIPNTRTLWHNNFPIRVTDLNYGNHLGNDRALAFAHELRMQWLQQHQLNELNVMGTGLILADAMILFRAEAFYPQVLTGELWSGDWSGPRWDLFYRFSCENKEVLRIKTGMVFFDYQARRPVPISPDFENFLKSQI